MACHPLGGRVALCTVREQGKRRCGTSGRPRVASGQRVVGPVHVIVVGCGRVGSGLAVALTAEGHSVAILDKSERAFRRLPDEWEGLRLVGSGFDRDDLERAGAVGAHALRR